MLIFAVADDSFPPMPLFYEARHAGFSSMPDVFSATLMALRAEDTAALMAADDIFQIDAVMPLRRGCQMDCFASAIALLFAARYLSFS